MVGEPVVAKSPNLGLIPTCPHSVGGALAPLVAPSNCVPLRVWEAARETLPQILVLESRPSFPFWLTNAATVQCDVLHSSAVAAEAASAGGGRQPAEEGVTQGGGGGARA